MAEERAHCRKKREMGYGVCCFAEANAAKCRRSMVATSLLCVLISVAIAVCAIGYFTFQLVVGEKGKARVDVLQQISEQQLGQPHQHGEGDGCTV